jgi:hypothetical protein
MASHTQGAEMETKSAPAGMSHEMTLLFAVAGAAAARNFYWARPLLSTD